VDNIILALSLISFFGLMVSWLALPASAPRTASMHAATASV
jgi:hypothetical protein